MVITINLLILIWLKMTIPSKEQNLNQKLWYRPWLSSLREVPWKRFHNHYFGTIFFCKCDKSKQLYGVTNCIFKTQFTFIDSLTNIFGTIASKTPVCWRVKILKLFYYYYSIINYCATNLSFFVFRVQIIQLQIFTNNIQ